MHFDTHDQLVLMGLLAVIAALLVAAPILRIPYPIFLVLGGLALGFVPGLPSLALPPDVVLIAVLPPLLYASAFFTSLRDLRANAVAIGMLAIPLVIVTMTAVAVVAHQWIDNMSWSASFVLGAIVSPTDPIAATAIARRLGVPRRVVTIVEGESLVNDATALVLYRAAVVAAVAGTFSFGDAALRFVASVAGGIAVGLAVGWLVALVRIRLDWAFPHTLLARVFFPSLRARDPSAPLGEAAVIGWTGMRGAVSLAAALAIPLRTNAGAPFPSRELIVYLAFCVILGTLVVQG